jgi:hypothetical protein
LTLSTFLICASFAGAALSWICVGFCYYRARQWRALDYLLFTLVLDAWRNQHLPIWTAWSALSGRRFIIDMVDVEDERRA